MADSRIYPDRPFLAVSAAIIRDGRVLVVQRLFTLPGGVVECGETLEEAITREVLEETALSIEPVGLAGHREVIACDAEKRVERHFVILSFAARWLAAAFLSAGFLAAGFFAAGFLDVGEGFTPSRAGASPAPTLLVGEGSRRT